MDPVTPALFRRACAQFATGICVATVFDGKPHGLTINSFTSVSLRPPVLLICLDREANLTSIFQRQHYFGVNILSEAQEDVSGAFAYKPDDRFGGVAWHLSEHGAPLISQCLASIECRLIRVLPVGDHDVLFGEALNAGFGDPAEPLLYFRSRYARREKPNSSLKASKEL